MRYQCECLVCERECEREVEANTNAEAKQEFIRLMNCRDLNTDDEDQVRIVG